MKSNLVLTGMTIIITTIVLFNAEAGERTTFANPLDLEYRMRAEKNLGFRECADPEIVLWDNRYWLFASKSGGYYVSADLSSWDYIPTAELPYEEYAPTAWVMDGKLHFSSRGGSIHRAIDPYKGRWERLRIRVPFTLDSNIYCENGRVYNYYGGTTNDIPLFVAELDPVTFKRVGATLPVCVMDNSRYGWDVRGHNNQMLTRSGCKEGAAIIKHDGKYYFQHATPGTEYFSYCDVALIGQSPKGPFDRQKLNPFSYKPYGYAKGAGHGDTFQDRYGNWWHITTCVVAGVNRRVVMFPVFFTDDGEMWCDTAFADWPIVVPNFKTTNPRDYHTGWIPLTYKKEVKVSSTFLGTKKGAIVDEDMHSRWSAATGNKGEWAEVDLGGVAKIKAIQLGFDHAGESDAWRSGTAVCRWRLDVSDDGEEWNTVIDESNASDDSDHPYRVLAKPVKASKIRVVCEGVPAGARFGLREIRAFGEMDIDEPEAPKEFAAIRNDGDRRRVCLSWSSVKGAEGYIVRYGPSLDKMHLAIMLRDVCKTEIRSLDAELDYFWSIEAFNAGGISPPKYPHPAPNPRTSSSRLSSYRLNLWP